MIIWNEREGLNRERDGDQIRKEWDLLELNGLVRKELNRK